MVVRAGTVRAGSWRGARAIAGTEEPVPSIPAVPFRGIQPFRYADHTIFFARGRETRQLLRLVDVYRGVFLYGDPGNGKSSLANAGLLPQAREMGFEPVRVRLQPRAGEELVIEPIAISDDGTEALPCVLAPETDGTSRVVVSIEEFEARVRSASESHQPLIVFDQFEEVLTLFEDDDASRLALSEMIVRLLREALPVKVLFIFREDYLGRVKQLLSSRPELVDQALRLGPPPADALPRIIRGPFDDHPGRYERELSPALAGRLQAALAQRFGSGDISPSEVQIVCLRLWESSDPAALLAAKGVQGLLEDELGEALDAFSPALRAAAIALLSEMVTSVGTRNVISAEDLRQHVRDRDPRLAPELLDEALDRLERESKLVRRERRRDLYLYEITSEFLVPWITQRREELRVVQERRRGRRRSRLAAACGLGGLIVLAVIAWSVLSRQAEVQRRAAVEGLADNITSLALASASSAAPVATRSDVSLALAFESYRSAPRAEARAAVINALLGERRSHLLAVLAGHSGSVYGVAIAPDARTLASAGDDGTVRLWDIATHRQLVELRSADDGVAAVAFSPDSRTLASAGADGAVRLWDIASRRQTAVLRGHAGKVFGVAFSPDGRLLASAGEDGTVRVRAVASHRQPVVLRPHAGSIFGVAFSPDGRTLATAQADHTVRLWRVATHREIGRLRGHSGQVTGVAFSSDGKSLASAGEDGTVRVWDVATRRQRGMLRSRAGPVFAVAFSPDSKTLASANADRTVRLWDAATYRQRVVLRGGTGAVYGVAFSSERGTLASASADGDLRLWNADSDEQPAVLRGDGPVRGVAFRPGTGTFASAGSDGTVSLWAASSQRRIAQLRTHAGAILGVAFSPDARTLAAAGADGDVRLWDAASHRRSVDLHGSGGSINGVAFAPDDGTVASAGDDGTVRVWQVASHRQIAVLREDTGPVSAVAFGRDGRTLASAGHDGTVRLWDVASHRRIAVMRGHVGTVNAVAFSPDGRTLASAGFDHTVLLWDAASHKARAALRGHTGGVTAVAFSPDGRTLASASDDHTVRLWDVATHKQLAVLQSDAGNAGIAFSADSTTLASAGDDGAVRIWTEIFWRSLTELHKTVCDIIVGGLTRSEWKQYAPGIGYRQTCP